MELKNIMFTVFLILGLAGIVHGKAIADTSVNEESASQQTLFRRDPDVGVQNQGYGGSFPPGNGGGMATTSLNYNGGGFNQGNGFSVESNAVGAGGAGGGGAATTGLQFNNLNPNYGGLSVQSNAVGGGSGNGPGGGMATTGLQFSNNGGYDGNPNNNGLSVHSTAVGGGNGNGPGGGMATTGLQFNNGGQCNGNPNSNGLSVQSTAVGGGNGSDGGAGMASTGLKFDNGVGPDGNLNSNGLSVQSTAVGGGNGSDGGAGMASTGLKFNNGVGPDGNLNSNGLSVQSTAVGGGGGPNGGGMATTGLQFNNGGNCDGNLNNNGLSVQSTAVGGGNGQNGGAGMASTGMQYNTGSNDMVTNQPPPPQPMPVVDQPQPIVKPPPQETQLAPTVDVHTDSTSQANVNTVQQPPTQDTQLPPPVNVHTNSNSEANVNTVQQPPPPSPADDQPHTVVKPPPQEPQPPSPPPQKPTTVEADSNSQTNIHTDSSPSPSPSSFLVPPQTQNTNTQVDTHSNSNANVNVNNGSCDDNKQNVDAKSHSESDANVKTGDNSNVNANVHSDSNSNVNVQNNDKPDNGKSDTTVKTESDSNVNVKTGDGSNTNAKADANASANANVKTDSKPDNTKTNVNANANANAHADANANANGNGNQGGCSGGGKGVCPAIVGTYCRYNVGAVQKPDQYLLPPEKIDLEICDYVAVEFAFLDKEKLTIKPTNGDCDYDLYKKVGNLQKTTFLTLGSYVDSGESEKYQVLFKNDDATKNFIEHTIKSLKEWGFDGLELCYIWPGAVQADISRGTEDEKVIYLEFVKKVYNAFSQAGLLLIVDIPWQKDIINKGFDLKTLQNSADALVMLTYDFGGSWMGKTGIFENLKPTGCESDNRSIDTSVQYVLQQGVQPCKLLITLGTIARTFTLNDENQKCVGAQISKGGPGGPELNAEGALNYIEACVAMNSNWAKSNVVSSYVDVKEASEIALYARNNKLAGVCIEAVDGDDSNQLCKCGASFPLTRTVHEIWNGANQCSISKDCLDAGKLNKLAPKCC